MIAPKNKAESIDLFSRGAYGNNVPTYKNTAEALRENSSERFVIRFDIEAKLASKVLLSTKFTETNFIRSGSSSFVKNGARTGYM